MAAPLGFALALCLLAVCCYDSGGKGEQLPSEQRYAQAKQECVRIRNDDRLAARRDVWEKLANEFADIYNTDPNWPNRPAALFRAAESLEELSARSYVKKDALQAAEWYERLAKAHPKSQLADDALYRAAHIRAARLGDDKAALALLGKLKKQYDKGDMLPLALTLEKAIQASRQGRTAPEARQVSRLQRDDIKEEAAAVTSAPAQPKRRDAAPAAVNAPQAVATNPSRPESTAREDAQKQVGQPVATTASLEGTIPAPVQPAVATTARETPARPELHLVSWDSPTKNSVEIVLEMSAPAKFTSRLVKQKGKASVVLDMDQLDILKELRRGAKITGSLLTAIRISQGKDGKAQLHFDFRDVRRFDTRKESSPCRIILSVAAGNTPLPRKSGANSGFAANETPAGEKSDVTSAGEPVLAAAEKEMPQETKETPMPEPRMTAATVPAAKGNTPRVALVSRELHKASITRDMASQLGLSVQRVFIDAGHGGHDPGTSHNNVLERTVTQEVAQTVGRLLRANGFEVVFSREKDNFVSLSERTSLANTARADLFVSIHVNANEDRRVQGVETYFLDIARSANAARVAALENAGSDRRLGDMQDMLAEVMLNARVGESRNLAKDVQRATLYRLKKREYVTRDGGVKSAPFHVLIGAQMPAVLVELGYCTNGEEAARLQDASYRQALAEGLAEGIMAYQKRLQNLQTAER